jgi:protein TonB
MKTFQPPQKTPPKKKRDYKVAAIVAVVVLGAAAGIAQVIKGDATPRKRVMETVALKLVPPPPPPPPKEPPPPPPPKMVEKQKIDPPQDKPEAPKPADAPPPGPLALDAKGGAGSDSFGLGGKLGGADYGPGGGSPYGHYGALWQAEISKLLRADERLRGMKFHGTIRLQVSANGAVVGIEVLHGTGDSAVDGYIRQDIGGGAVSEAPPDNVPKIVIRVRNDTDT